MYKKGRKKQQQFAQLQQPSQQPILQIQPTIYWERILEVFRFRLDIEYDDSFQLEDNLAKIENALRRSFSSNDVRLLSVSAGSTILETLLSPSLVYQKALQYNSGDSCLLVGWIDGSDATVLSTSYSVQKQYKSFQKAADLVDQLRRQQLLLQQEEKQTLLLQQAREPVLNQFVNSLPKNYTPDQIASAFLNRQLTNINNLQPFYDDFDENNDDEDNSNDDSQ
jgi:hypothetical protein